MYDDPQQFKENNSNIGNIQDLIEINQNLSERIDNLSCENVIKLRPSTSAMPNRKHRILKPKIIIDRKNNNELSPGKESESPSPTILPRYG